MKKLLSLLGLLLALTPPTHAAQLVLWSFPTPLAGIVSGTAINPTVENVTGSPTLVMRNQAIDANGKDGVAYTDSTGVNRPATANGAIAWDDFRGGGDDGEVRMNLNTTGFVDISLRFDIKLNDDPIDSSPRSLLIDYSTDGGVNFVPVVTLTITNNNAFSAKTVNLSDIAAVEGAANLIIRLSQGGGIDATALNDSVSFDNLEITGTAGGAGSPAPVLTVSPATTDRLDLPVENIGIASGVIGDPTDPAAQQGILFTLADPDTPVGSLVVTRTSDNLTVAPLSGLVITGSGASRTLRITPAAVGVAEITVTVTDPQGNTDTYRVYYVASAASSTPATSRYHTGASDASAAVPIAPGLMLVANDEDQVLRLYDRANSGLPLTTFNLNTSLALAKEADLEATIRIGNRVYWIGSHGNERDGDDAPTRRTAFSTDLTGSGAATVPVFVNKYTGLRTDLIAWDNSNGHGLGAGALGLQASAAAPVLPTLPNGFNIEGAALAQNGSTVLLGFRAPLQSTSARNRALVIPATNLTSVIDAGAGPVTFGAPIFLDLGGRAIRSMDTTSTGQILILAGPVNDRVAGVEANTFKIFLWDGSAANPPVPLTSTIDAVAANAAGSPEAIFDIPAPLVNGSSVGILIDNGSTDHYGNGVESKDLLPNEQKFRADTVVLTGLTPLVTTTADAGAGSLREAIAGATSGGTIFFAPALSGQTILLTSGQLTLSKNLTIDASALTAGITLSGNDASRIFEVTSGRVVTLSGLTLRDGFDTNGGAIFNNGGVLTVSGCTLLGNIAQRGAAIYSVTDLGSLRTTVVNTTITGNFATVGGGAIYNDIGLTEVRHCTITENSAPAGEGGGIASYGDSLTHTAVRDSIISGNADADLDLVVSTSTNSFAAAGENLVRAGDALGAFPLAITDPPLLAALAHYGGPTPTMPPLPGSPAIDRTSGSATTADQRGLARPVDGNLNGTATPDIGAVEFQPAVVDNAQDDGTGSLRAAIAAPFASTVTFDAAFFNGEPTDTITLASELAISRPLAIDGSAIAEGVIISGNRATRVLHLSSGADVSLKCLSITGGDSGSSPGGGILIDGGARLAVNDSLIAENFTDSVGGGIMVFDGAVTIVNSTLAHNIADDGGAIWAQGGASSLALTHATVSANSGTYATVSFVNATLHNSIVTGNYGGQIYESGTLNLLGQNLTTDYPLLNGLGHYGGPTRTMPPMPFSFAIDAAVSSPLLSDQRGAPRSTGLAPDIGAAEYQPAIVTNPADTGPGTLRSAVAGAFASTVTFDLNIFDGEPGDTIFLTSAVPIAKSLDIDALNNGGVKISGSNLGRIFTVSGLHSVRLVNLTLADGNAGSSGDGGAIRNDGCTLTLLSCTLTSNFAGNFGGAIYTNGGFLSLNDCTIAGNSANFGGGILSRTNLLYTSQTSLDHCTVTDNTATITGGGIYNIDGRMFLDHCTISGNSAPAGRGGGVASYGDLATETLVGFSIIAGNGSTDVDFVEEGSNSFTSGLSNLIGTGNAIADFDPPGNITGIANPLLAPLANYGGLTPTMALLPGSLARNAATGSSAFRDQRGFPIFGVPDIGAYEAGYRVNYAAWAYETLPPGSNYAFTADPGNNGLANGLEYAFLTDALAANPGPLPLVDPGAAHTVASLTFPIRVASSDLIYEIERSTTLGSWATILGVDLRDGSTIFHDPAVTFLDLNGSYITFQDPFIAGQSKVFYRLRVSETAP